MMTVTTIHLGGSPIPPHLGKYIRVSHTTGVALSKVGYHVTRDAFLESGRHGCYWVRADDLPPHVLLALGDRSVTTAAMNNAAAGVTAAPKKVRRVPVNSETVLVYSGVKRKFKRKSARQTVFDFIVSFAETPLYRRELYQILRDGTDLCDSTISSNLSFFVHHSGVLNLVKKDEY